MNTNIILTRPFSFLLLSFIVTLLISAQSAAQHLTLTGTTFTIGAGTSFTTSGSITIGAGSTIQNNGALTIGGDLINDGLGLGDSSPGSVHFIGTSQQTIGGSSAIAFTSVTIDNASGVVLQNNASVAQILTLVNGVFETGEYELLLKQPCLYPIAGASADRFVRSTGSGASVLQVDEICSSAMVQLGDPYLPLTYTASGVAGGAVEVRFATGAGRSPLGIVMPPGDGIVPANSMNQYIVVQHRGVGQVNAYTLAFDMQSTAHAGNTANYVVRRYNVETGWTTIPSTLAGSLVTTSPVPVVAGADPEQRTDMFLVGEFDATLDVASDEQATSASADVFPNPTSSQLTVRFTTRTSQPYAIKVYDISGRAIIAHTGMSTSGVNLQALEVGSLSKGLYLLCIEIQNSAPRTQRIVVQ